MKPLQSPVRAEQSAAQQTVQQPRTKPSGAMKYITLQNRSDSDPQHVFVVGEDGKGRRYTLPPSHVVPFPEDVAKVFLRDCSKFVKIFQQVFVPDSQPGMPKAWIANATGNPALPLTIEVTRVVHGENTRMTLPNPLRQAMPLSFKIHRSQEVTKDQDGEHTWNWPPDVLCLPPYERVAVPANVAMQLQNRDGMQDAAYRGRLITCRPPSAFEPNESWEYEDLRAWAVIVAPQNFGEGRMQKNFPATSKLEEDRIEEKKWELLHELFFIKINDKYNLPSREQFEAMKASLPTEVA